MFKREKLYECFGYNCKKDKNMDQVKIDSQTCISVTEQSTPRSFHVHTCQ